MQIITQALTTETCVLLRNLETYFATCGTEIVYVWLQAQDELRYETGQMRFGILNGTATTTETSGRSTDTKLYYDLRFTNTNSSQQNNLFSQLVKVFSVSEVSFVIPIFYHPFIQNYYS